jgi:hypothetical protein
MIYHLVGYHTLIIFVIVYHPDELGLGPGLFTHFIARRMTFIHYWELSYIRMRWNFYFGRLIIMNGRDGLKMMLVRLCMVSLKDLWSQCKYIHLVCRLLLPEDIWWQHYITTRLFPAFGLDFYFLKDLFILSDIPETIILGSSLFPSTSLVRENFLRDLMIIRLNLLNEVRWY